MTGGWREKTELAVFCAVAEELLPVRKRAQNKIK